MPTKVPSAAHRPYTLVGATQPPSPMELEALAEYSRQRFVVGRRFRLRQDYAGRPAGAVGTVISGWPATRIRWQEAIYRQHTPEITDVHQDLDDLLEYVDG